MVNQPDATRKRIAAIYAAATKFRVALEKGGLPLISLADFPRGSCGDTCELFGQFLIDSGFGEWLYCSGQRDEPFHTHAWLEQQGLILDITADQFPDIHQRVLLTLDHSWHARFLPVTGRRIAGRRVRHRGPLRTLAGSLHMTVRLRRSGRMASCCVGWATKDRKSVV